MKLLYLVCLCAAIVTSKEVPKVIEHQFERMIADIKDQCIKQTNVDPILVDNMMTKNEFVDDNEPLKCYFGCIYHDMGVFFSNGQFDAETFARIYPTVTAEITLQCLPRTLNLQECEKSYQMAKCLLEKVAV